MAEQEQETKPPRWTAKKLAVLALKIGVSAVGLYLVWNAALKQEGWNEIAGRLERLHWGWFAFGSAMQCIGIGFGILRWRAMLGGQGIKASFKFLIPSFMIGRFWGAFTPGGFGLDGWKIFDVGFHTKKYARTVAVIVVEKFLGQLAFGIAVMTTSPWGVEFIGLKGVILVNVFFVVLVATGMTLIAKPALFRLLGKLLPRQFQPKLHTLVDALCAYHGKPLLLLKATLFGAGVHFFHFLVYVCAARALGIDLSAGLILFASAIQVMSTFAPVSVNGVGLREATAVALYTAVGLSSTEGALIATVGFAAEMVVSATGFVPLLVRRLGGKVSGLEVEDADREDKYYATVPDVPEALWPRRARALAIGAGAGFLAGVIVGVVEGAVVIAGANGHVGVGVMAYGALVYGLFCAVPGALMLFFFAQTGRWMKREAMPEPASFARTLGFFVAAWTFALALFRIRRDVFHEELVLKSKEGALVVLACAAGAAIVFALFAVGLRLATARKIGSFLLRPWGPPAIGGAAVLALAALSFIPRGEAYVPPRASHEAPADAPNVLVIVVDTMRADHLPAYGYEHNRTPNLDRFAEDAVRFDRAYANASWTRPSFASILSGRYASSHGVMGKDSALPDPIVTMPEALHDHGYQTAGFVTNYNVAPFYNFQQGFDSYAYFEPDFVLGADDTAAKLLLVQALRQQIERVRSFGGRVEPGVAYQDAETVNRGVTAWLDNDRRQNDPFFLFVAYMDPHDPYYRHPYDGTGYSRAAHQAPALDEAEMLRELYDGEIEYWDEHFGALMDDLRRRGVYDDTMIIVTSDHGEEFGEHGGFWHGTTLYDEQLHVPLFVKLPNSERAGTHVSHWVQSIDLMPSILRRVGIDVPRGVQGANIEEGSTRLFAEESHEGNVLASVRELRDFEERKIITANANNPRGLAPVELYRTADDPGEDNDLAESDRDDVRAMLRSLEEARRNATEGAIEAPEVESNEDSDRRLCNLGYLDAAECCRRGFLSGDQCRGS
jgi:arylsulfatase A-like enzyme